MPRSSSGACVRSATSTDPAVHCACLPFPSPQGTQAALAAMLDALARAGREAPLLCYPHGDARVESSVAVTRLAMPTPTRSLRSGPSLGKVLLDLGMIDALRRHPFDGPWVCHHVEAAWAARLAGRRYVYVAHTSLEDELGTYLPRRLSSAMAGLGARIDAFAIGGALACAAVSPALGARLESRHGRPFERLPIPWAPSEPGCRESARRTLGLDERAFVLLYTGNLDGYQNWEEALDVAIALRRRGLDAWLLTATESEPTPLFARARHVGLRALTLSGLSSEEARRRVHAAADVAIVPRRSPGGVPIKLLDALARGVPVATTRAAMSGLPLEDVVHLGESTAELAQACLDAWTERDARIERGRSFLRTNHTPKAFLDAYTRLVPPL